MTRYNIKKPTGRIHRQFNTRLFLVALVFLLCSLLAGRWIGASHAIADSSLSAKPGCYLIDSNFSAHMNSSVCAGGKDSDGTSINAQQFCYSRNSTEPSQDAPHEQDCTNFATIYPETIPAPGAGSPQAPAGCYLNTSDGSGQVELVSTTDACKGNGGKDDNGNPIDLTAKCYYDTNTSDFPENTLAPIAIDCGVVAAISPATAGTSDPGVAQQDPCNPASPGSGASSCAATDVVAQWINPAWSF